MFDIPLRFSIAHARELTRVAVLALAVGLSGCAASGSGSTNLTPEAVAQRYAIKEAEAAFRLGRRAEDGRDYAAARIHYRRALEFSPDNVKYRLYAGQVAKNLNDHSEAEAHFERALGSVNINYRDDPHAFFTLNRELAEVYVALGKYAKAEQLYLDAIKREKEGSGRQYHLVGYVYLNLAGIYERQEKFAQTKALLLEALEISKKVKFSPDGRRYARGYRKFRHSQGHHALGSFFFRQRKYKEALPDLERAVDLDSNTVYFPHWFRATANRTLAITYMQLGRFDDAIAPLETALKSAEKTRTDNPYQLAKIRDLYETAKKKAGVK